MDLCETVHNLDEVLYKFLEMFNSGLVVGSGTGCTWRFILVYFVQFSVRESIYMCEFIDQYLHSSVTVSHYSVMFVYKTLMNHI